MTGYVRLKKNKNIAIIGSGIAGLYTAWQISKKYNVTVFEKNKYFGGHSNTFDVFIKNKKIPVDTGFIVFNKKNYPYLTNLFKTLKVPIQKSNMSFSVDLQNKDFYYAGSLTKIFAQKKNLLKKNFWKMVIEIINFYKKASNKKKIHSNESLKKYLNKKNYSKEFKENHIYPMASAIWSTNHKEIGKMPVQAFINFFNNHGLFKFFNRPTWYTVKGGSKNYVQKILKNTKAKFKRNINVIALKKKEGKIEVITKQERFLFDGVVLACHADQASKIIKEVDSNVSSILRNFKYSKNLAFLHNDKKFMPKNKSIWSSWNYISLNKNNSKKHFFTYWMNKLQNIKNNNIFLTLNPPFKPNKIYYSTMYEHPIFTKNSMDIPSKLNKVQGRNGVWYCGSYFYYGFHEDAIKSSINIIKKIENEFS